MLARFVVRVNSLIMRPYQSMRETLDYLDTFVRFPFALRRFLRHTLTMDDARRIVRERMEQREENFLCVVERSIYGNPRSPYLKLLTLAGCELGDLRVLVKNKGLEGALRELRGQGVYITFEEFKGRRPIVRRGKTFAVTADDFDDPFGRRLFNLTTGGSSGAALNVGVDLQHIAASAPHELLRFSAHGLLNMPSMRWNPILPSATLRTILRGVYVGDVLMRWFSPIGLRDSKYWIKYGLATYHILAWMRLLGVPAPWPEYVKPDQAIVIARSVAGTVRDAGAPVACTRT